MTLGNVAAASAFAAIGALIVAGITIALFFGGAGDYWGPVNDVFSAIALLLLVPVMVAVLRLAPDDIGPWFAIITYLAIAGALLGAAGQVVLVLGGISLQASFVTGGIGLMPILAWGIGLAVLVFSRDMLSVVVGWLLVGVLLSAILLTVVSQFAPWPVIASAGVITLVLLVAWLAALSGELPSAV